MLNRLLQATPNTQHHHQYHPTLQCNFIRMFLYVSGDPNKWLENVLVVFVCKCGATEFGICLPSKHLTMKTKKKWFDRIFGYTWTHTHLLRWAHLDDCVTDDMHIPIALTRLAIECITMSVQCKIHQFNGWCGIVVILHRFSFGHAAHICNELAMRFEIRYWHYCIGLWKSTQWKSISKMSTHFLSALF